MKAIEEIIRDKYAQLPTQERKLADFILDRPSDLAIFNSAELARLCGVSKATVSRMFKRLGYSSFKEGRVESRRQRQQGVPVVEGKASKRTYAPHFEREINNLKLLQASLSEDSMSEMAEALAAARLIKVVGFRNSYPIALHIRQQLIQVRAGVDLAPLPGQTLAEELEGLGADDMVIFIAFRRRPKLFDKALNHMIQRKIPVLLITDASLRKIADRVKWWVECPLESVSGFDGYSAAMSFATLICNTLLHQMAVTGQSRILSISDAYREMNELDFI
ncbi:MurR/RpiR family transcriptional regulator [Marinobacterium sp. D7]|uniref:MurR/RpiR family transcriptional regulator n=1 Tax=Marinobacterium ramblicola TaxID=2849041 RepID=UPI001C2DE414|nr:MurR/RpiR family transcriptional regulator [Marinobacterium ramblicola]MBV1787459.1 MurR/RpiR family transcriptional regulator [Marinobacterium ramblicola]